MGQPAGLLVVCPQTPADIPLGSSQSPHQAARVPDCTFTGYIWIPRNRSVALSFHRGTRFSARTAKETKKRSSFQPLPCPHLVPSWEMKSWSCQLSHPMPHLALSHPRGSAQEAGSRAYLSPPLSHWYLCPAWESLSRQETLLSFLSGFLPDLLSLSK